MGPVCTCGSLWCSLLSAVHPISGRKDGAFGSARPASEEESWLPDAAEVVRSWALSAEMARAPGSEPRKSRKRRSRERWRWGEAGCYDPSRYGVKGDVYPRGLRTLEPGSDLPSAPNMAAAALPLLPANVSCDQR